jgi:hypothetical protein
MGHVVQHAGSSQCACGGANAGDHAVLGAKAVDEIGEIRCRALFPGQPAGNDQRMDRFRVERVG